MPRRLRHVDEGFVAGNRIRLLHDGREAFPAMLDAIGSAKRQILLEMYWFDSDRIGRRFAAALTDAVKRGVEVAVLYDAIGSIGAAPEMFADLAAAGAKVVEYNPVTPWKRRFKLDRLTRRDHRKILVVDGVVGFTGGINIADCWLPEEEEGDGWRDDMVCVEGPAVRGLVRCFFAGWRDEDGPELSREPTRESMLGELYAGGAGQHQVRVVGEAYFRNRHSISRAYLHHIYRATRRVWIENSYFVPDTSVILALQRAARRGVDVRIVVPGKSDVAITAWASRAVWGRLLKRGARLFEWTKSVLHSKTCVIDGRWSTIGSFNLDQLSLRSNLEVAVTVLDEGLAASMERAFERDLAECQEVDPQNFRYRSLSERLLEQVAYRFRKFL